MSIKIISGLQRRRLRFFPHFWSCVLRHSKLSQVAVACSSLFWPVRDCSGLFPFLQVETSQNILTYKLNKINFMLGFISKRTGTFTKCWQLWCVWKVEQVLLDKGTAFFDTKWEKYCYKVRQVLQGGAIFTIR